MQLRIRNNYIDDNSSIKKHQRNLEGYHNDKAIYDGCKGYLKFKESLVTAMQFITRKISAIEQFIGLRIITKK